MAIHLSLSHKHSVGLQTQYGVQQVRLGRFVEMSWRCTMQATRQHTISSSRPCKFDHMRIGGYTWAQRRSSILVYCHRHFRHAAQALKDQEMDIHKLTCSKTPTLARDPHSRPLHPLPPFISGSCRGLSNQMSAYTQVPWWSALVPENADVVSPLTPSHYENG